MIRRKRRLRSLVGVAFLTDVQMWRKRENTYIFCKDKHLTLLFGVDHYKILKLLLKC